LTIPAKDLYSLNYSAGCEFIIFRAIAKFAHERAGNSFFTGFIKNQKFIGNYQKWNS